MDAVPLSIGIEVAGGQMLVIIPRNTPVPVTKTKTLTTKKEVRTSVSILIYEGERTLTQHNHYLGELVLTGISAGTTSNPQIEVIFQIGRDGMLNCTAAETRKSKKFKEVNFQCKVGSLPKEEITAQIQNASNFAQQDELEKERIDARLNLDTLCIRLNAAMTSPANHGKDYKLRNQVLKICGLTESWIADNPNLPQKEYEKKYREVNNKCEPIRRQLINMRQEPCDDDYQPD